MKKNPFEEKLISRDTISLLPCELADVDDYPENVVIRLDNTDRRAPLDFGSFAFTERDAKLRTTPNRLNAIKVNVDSFVEHRQRVLLFIFDYIFCTKLTENTLRGLYYNCRSLFGLLDSHGCQDAFRNSACARIAYEKYCALLAIQLACEDIRPFTAHQRQNLFKWLLLGCFPDDANYITHGVASFPSLRRHYRAPEDAEVRRFVQITHTIGATVSEFIVGNRSFPFLLEVLNFKKYIFPFNDARLGKYPKAYDLVNRNTGEFESVETLTERFPNSPVGITNEKLRYTNRHLQQSNKEMRCTARIRLASVAASAYTLLIQLIAGISPAELREIRYSDVIDITTGSVATELLSVKNRARGKKTFYSLGGKIGRKVLLDYLRIRSWLLNGKGCEYLFIRLEKLGAYTSNVGQQRLNYSSSAVKKIRKLLDGEEFTYIGSSLGRKYKSLMLHELKRPTKLTAAILNHEEKTNAVSYAETSPERSQVEFQNYWKSVREHAALILNRGTSNNDVNLTSNSVGGCTAYNNPSAAISHALLVPDCTLQFGCLYCDNYVFHADKEDLHKLLSLKYVIQEIRNYASPVQHANELLKDLMIRIDQIVLSVSEISDTHRQLVFQLNHRVFGLGDLTAFWEARLHRLELSGVVLS